MKRIFTLLFLTLSLSLQGACERTGDSKYVSIARRHADTTIKNHFREDGSSFHVVSYDPLTGEPHAKNTTQGYSDSSSWARGKPSRRLRSGCSPHLRRLLFH